MAKVLLDSDVIIEWLLGQQPFVEHVPALIAAHTELFWTPVSVAEVFAGVRKGEHDAVANLFLLLEPISISVEAGRKAGDYLKSYASRTALNLVMP